MRVWSLERESGVQSGEIREIRMHCSRSTVGVHALTIHSPTALQVIILSVTADSDSDSDTDSDNRIHFHSIDSLVLPIAVSSCCVLYCRTLYRPVSVL